MNQPLSQKASAREEDAGRQISEYIAVVRRYKLQIMVVAAILGGSSAGVAVALPPLYRSSATILVQEQEIPRDLVRSTVTSFADERIEIISQQVLTRAVLLPLIEKYDLYEKLRKKETDQQIVDRMRKDIQLTTIDASISERSSGRPVNTTIAFQISYDSRQPDRAHQVVKDLVELYLFENTKARQQSVAETTAFLAAEAERVADQIRLTEQKLADFKRRYAGFTPDSLAINVQLAERTGAEILRNEREISLVQDRILSLEAQRHLIKPNLPFATDTGGERALTPEARLQALMTEYLSASALYSAEHPKMRQLQRQIDALKAAIGAPDKDAKSLGKLRQLEAELADLKRRYADDHPDIRQIERSIAALQASATSKRTTATASNAGSDNPAYIALTTQLDSARRELAYLAELRNELREKQRLYDERLSQIPEVEREYRDLTRDYENAQSHYRSVKTKQMEAEIAQTLEKERKAERFTLVEPPVEPAKPIKPDRKRIALIGLVASLGGGFGLALLRDLIDPSVKGPQQLARIASVPILNPIPYIETRRERFWTRARVWFVVGVSPLLAAAFFVGASTVLKFWY